MLQGKTGTQLRLKLLHNVRFWACVILTPQMSRKYSLFFFFPPGLASVAHLMLLDPAMFSGRDKEHWLNILLGKKNHTPVFCKCASCILKMTPYRDHAKENKITAFCLKKKGRIFRVNHFLSKSQDHCFISKLIETNHLSLK